MGVYDRPGLRRRAASVSIIVGALLAARPRTSEPQLAISGCGRRAPSLMARYAAVGRCLRHLAFGACRPASPVSEYFGRTSPRPQPLAGQRADLQQPYRIRSRGGESAKSLRRPLDSGVLVCEALRERSEQRTNKHPEVGGCPTQLVGSRCKQRSYKVLSFSTAAASVSSSFAKQNRNRCPASGFSQNTDTGMDATPMSRVHLLAIDSSDSLLISL